MLAWALTIGLSIVLLTSCLKKESSNNSINWNTGVTANTHIPLKSHINAVADIMGPVDGSAVLTIYTEGNHYPVFNQLVLDGFPEWYVTTGKCSIEPEQILLITLPQYILESSLSSGKLSMGNLIIPLDSNRVYPDIVFAGEKVLNRLEAKNIIIDKRNKLATHRGMAILAKNKQIDQVKSVEHLFLNQQLKWVYASEKEKGARAQYMKTIKSLYGENAVKNVLNNEVHFEERAYIQHRDIPYALINDYADYGLLFYHLAAYYAEDERLDFITIPEAEPFGMSMFWSRSKKSPSHLSRKFEEYLEQVKDDAYKGMFNID